MTITTWRDLPHEYRAKYLKLAYRYMASRLYDCGQSARQAAFEQVRDHYWHSQKVGDGGSLTT